MKSLILCLFLYGFKDIFLKEISCFKINLLKKENYYVVVTSNGNVFNIIIENIDGKITPTCKQIDTSNSLLSSVGRRMTSLIFGGGSSNLSGAKVFFTKLHLNMFAYK